MDETVVVEVQTPLGPGRFMIDPAQIDRAPGEADSLLVLGHGAGGGPNAADLALLAGLLPQAGVTVARFEQPWRTAGRKVAVPPAKLDEAWRPAVRWLLHQTWGSGRLFFGGRSAGARVACRTADDFAVAGVVCLAFPLHLPGRPERSRLPELLAPSAPRLVLQGSRDTLGSAAELQTALGGAAGVRVVTLPGADHSYRTPAKAEFTPAQLRAALVREVGRFVTDPTGEPG